MAFTAQGCRPRPYSRRRPESTTLYHVVQHHLETDRALASQGDWDGQRVPACVEREFRLYLACAILAYGFARARCAACGHDRLAPFSCKGRGLCPACTTRRRAQTAAHLVGHVFPPLPVRQWGEERPRPVDSRGAPKGRTGCPHCNEPPGMVPTARGNERLRWYLEREPKALSAVLHILLRVID